ncbi:hypothetical protein D9758_009333 [Tetrapyrgos nigripes]|uniref:Uncharacterized protein n=1 Tax=Tetrapyrgos nigripes TaxID=182062 RepID=A0A8H5GGX0_9AGAR|nr:hypothetical protein D9758_009333 [Tetrapyrgos nigripes]
MRTRSSSIAQTPQPPSRPTSSAMGMTPETRYHHNLKVLRRRDPSIVSIFDQFSHVCVYHHNGERWEKNGYEGSMFLYERNSYPPYGFYILNRMGMDDHIQRLYPWDKVDASNSITMLRSFPFFAKSRTERIQAEVSLSSDERPHLDKFADVYKWDKDKEQVSDSDMGEPVTIGLWFYNTEGREPMKEVLSRLLTSIQENVSYPEEFRYGPHNPAPTSSHPSVAGAGQTPSARAPSVASSSSSASASSPNISHLHTRSQSYSPQMSKIKPKEKPRGFALVEGSETPRASASALMDATANSNTASELDKLFAKLTSSSNPVTPTPSSSSSLSSAASPQSASSSKTVKPGLTTKLTLESLFASASSPPAEESQHATATTTSTSTSTSVSLSNGTTTTATTKTTTTTGASLSISNINGSGDGTGLALLNTIFASASGSGGLNPPLSSSSTSTTFPNSTPSTTSTSSNGGTTSSLSKSSRSRDSSHSRSESRSRSRTRTRTKTKAKTRVARQLNDNSYHDYEEQDPHQQEHQDEPETIQILSPIPTTRMTLAPSVLTLTQEVMDGLLGGPSSFTPSSRSGSVREREGQRRGRDREMNGDGEENQNHKESRVEPQEAVRNMNVPALLAGLFASASNGAGSGGSPASTLSSGADLGSTSTSLSSPQGDATPRAPIPHEIAPIAAFAPSSSSSSGLGLGLGLVNGHGHVNASSSSFFPSSNSHQHFGHNYIDNYQTYDYADDGTGVDEDNEEGREGEEQEQGEEGEEQDDDEDEILELDFSETKVLSDLRSFEAKKKGVRGQRKKNERERVNGHGHVVNGTGTGTSSSSVSSSPAPVSVHAHGVRVPVSAQTPTHTSQPSLGEVGVNGVGVGFGVHVNGTSTDTSTEPPNGVSKKKIRRGKGGKGSGKEKEKEKELHDHVAPVPAFGQPNEEEQVQAQFTTETLRSLTRSLGMYGDANVDVDAIPPASPSPSASPVPGAGYAFGPSSTSSLVNMRVSSSSPSRGAVASVTKAKGMQPQTQTQSLLDALFASASPVTASVSASGTGANQFTRKEDLAREVVRLVQTDEAFVDALWNGWQERVRTQ